MALLTMLGFFILSSPRLRNKHPYRMYAFEMLMLAFLFNISVSRPIVLFDWLFLGLWYQAQALRIIPGHRVISEECWKNHEDCSQERLFVYVWTQRDFYFMGEITMMLVFMISFLLLVDIRLILRNPFYPMQRRLVRYNLIIISITAAFVIAQ